MYSGTFDNWFVGQCGKLTPMVGVQYNYQYSVNPSVLDPEYLFQNDNSANFNCPLTSCQILEQGCANQLVVQAITMITSPLGIQINLDLASGFMFTLCLRCSNGYQTEDLDNLLI